MNDEQKPRMCTPKEPRKCFLDYDVPATYADGSHTTTISTVMLSKIRPSGCVGCAHPWPGEAPAPPIAPAQWSTTPPKEPGWYWRRRQIRKLQDKFPDDVYGAPHIVRVYSKDGTQWDDFGEIPTTGDEFLQWWPVRIDPPR